MAACPRLPRFPCPSRPVAMHATQAGEVQPLYLLAREHTHPHDVSQDGAVPHAQAFGQAFHR